MTPVKAIRSSATLTVAFLLALSVAFATAGAGEPSGAPVFSNPLNFTNELFPFKSGGIKMYTGKDQGARIAQLDLYLSETRVLIWNGTPIACRILREVAFEDGELVESTDSYFAQADNGIVYYFGELVYTYLNGVIIDNEGSTLVGGPTLSSDPPGTGVETNPTVYMPVNPKEGDEFVPETFNPVTVVTDIGSIPASQLNRLSVATDTKVNVPAGRYEGAVVFKESSKLVSDTALKWYVPGVGFVMEKSKGQRLQLESSTLVPFESSVQPKAFDPRHSVAASTNRAVPTGTPTFSNPLIITHVYFPFQPGAIKMSAGKDQGAKTAGLDLYLNETRSLIYKGAPVACRILREVAFESGRLVESTDNYFAQSDDGTVYYFGEVVDNYEDGVIVNHNGSWLVGGPVLTTDPSDTGNDDEPTVFIPANPAVGDVFKPEDLFPIVDETAEIMKTGQKVKVLAGKYTDAIVVQESSKLAPGTALKWYVAGVGVVLAKSKGEILQLESSTFVQKPK